MKLKQLFLILILSLFLCISLGKKVTFYDEAVKSSFFAGRSADVIIQPENFVPNNDSLLVSFDEEQSDSLSISDVDIAYSVLAPSHGIGTSDENDIQLPDTKNDIFSKTKLNLLFIVESIGNEIISSFHGLKSLVGQHRTVKQTAFPEDNISLTTSIISGREPRAHGIVGSNWQVKSGQPVSAFKSPKTMSLVPNYPDVLSKLFLGNSLVLGASGDFQLASSISAHPALFADHPFWNDFGFYWDETLDSFESLYPFAFYESDLMLSKEKIGNIFKKTIGDVSIEFDKNQMSVAVKDKNLYTSFRTSDKEDFSFIAETRFILNMLDVLETKESWKKLIKDDYPDFIALGFSSISKILSSYGLHSNKFKSSIYVLDALITHTTNRLKKLYEESVHAHALYLSVGKVNFDSSVEKVVKSVLENSFDNRGVVDLPAISVDDKSKVGELCEQINNALYDLEVKVYCPSLTFDDKVGIDGDEAYEEQQIFKKRFQPYQYVLELENNSTNHTITYTDVMIFQLMFWFSLSLIAALICGSCAVFMVDIPRNSNLIRQLPNIYHSTIDQKNLW